METINKIPFNIIVIVVLAYLGYQFYDFELGAQGARAMHQAAITAKTAEIEQFKKKKIEAEKFYSQLESKRQELYRLIDDLNGMQASLSDGLEVPAMIKLLVTEAKNTGIKVDRIEPGAKKEKEFYLEQEFRLTVRGTYVQVVTFLDRVAHLKRILRIEGFDLAPKNQSSSKYIISEAKLSVRAYQYAKSKADDLYNELKSKKDAVKR